MVVSPLVFLLRRTADLGKALGIGPPGATPVRTRQMPRGSQSGRSLSSPLLCDPTSQSRAQIPLAPGAPLVYLAARAKPPQARMASQKVARTQTSLRSQDPPDHVRSVAVRRTLSGLAAYGGAGSHSSAGGSHWEQVLNGSHSGCHQRPCAFGQTAPRRVGLREMRAA